MNPVVHFEMPYQDRDRIADFYAKAFGWEPEMLGPEMGDYVSVKTSECDESGLPKNRGMINGGFFKKTDDMPAQYPSVVIAVEDITEAIRKLQEAGGEALGEPMDIPGVGLYIAFLDTEGNRASLLQPSAM